MKRTFKYLTTTKNYGYNEMHWLWMVLVCVLLLLAWWKLRKVLQVPRSLQRGEKEQATSQVEQEQLEEKIS